MPYDLKKSCSLTWFYKVLPTSVGDHNEHSRTNQVPPLSGVKGGHLKIN